MSCHGKLLVCIHRQLVLLLHSYFPAILPKMFSHDSFTEKYYYCTLLSSYLPIQIDLPSDEKKREKPAPIIIIQVETLALCSSRRVANGKRITVLVVGVRDIHHKRLLSRRFRQSVRNILYIKYCKVSYCRYQKSEVNRRVDRSAAKIP